MMRISSGAYSFYRSFIGAFTRPVNIIGKHTDYNEGFVLLAVIDKAIFVAFGKRQTVSFVFCLYSVNWR